ncbi:MAG: hypothetical protein H7Y11_13505, partial [Armatimonadetes bacterium]|nr:hypothetical protein [Anaerolineae bacterium]
MTYQNYHTNIQLASLRQAEIRAAADHQHLVEIAAPQPVYAPVLHTVGHLLVALGSHLEARYGELPDTT